MYPDIQKKESHCQQGVSKGRWYSWGTLRIPREDLGTLGKIRGITTRLKNPIIKRSVPGIRRIASGEMGARFDGKKTCPFHPRLILMCTVFLCTF